MTTFNEADIKKYIEGVQDRRGWRMKDPNNDLPQAPKVSRYPNKFAHENDVIDYFLNIINSGTSGIQNYKPVEGYTGAFYILSGPDDIVEKYGSGTFNVELKGISINAISNTSGEKSHIGDLKGSVKLTASLEDAGMGKKYWKLTKIETDDPYLAAAIKKHKDLGDVLPKKLVIPASKSVSTPEFKKP